MTTICRKYALFVPQLGVLTQAASTTARGLSTSTCGLGGLAEKMFGCAGAVAGEAGRTGLFHHGTNQHCRRCMLGDGIRPRHNRRGFR